MSSGKKSGSAVGHVVGLETVGSGRGIHVMDDRAGGLSAARGTESGQ